jgi:hypothetical protein
MVKHVELSEAPAIKVTKRGKDFHVGEISAFNLAKVHHYMVEMNPDEIAEALEIFFGKESLEVAKGLFTINDLKQISAAIVERERGPLAESSDETPAEDPSPSETPSES